MSETMEDQMRKNCDESKIRGVVLLASARNGAFHYQNVFGRATPDQKMTMETTFLTASCSKLVTTIAVLQCVERGLVGLDDDIAPILHELRDINILVGFHEESGDPILEKAKLPITLRQLLTHSSGLAYDHSNPLMRQWRAFRKEQSGIPKSNFTQVYSLPLLFEPGRGWEYGAGIEWVGILVSRLNDHVNLETYLDENIWKPLGITNMTFHLQNRPDIRERLPKMTRRMADTGELQWTNEAVLPDPIEDELGGVGLYSTAADYLKILRSICENDQKLLKSQTVDEMFRPQLSAESHRALAKQMTIPAKRNVFGIPIEVPVDFGLGGILNLEPMPSGRKRGSMSWGGLPNLKWWIDRETGLCGFYGSQLVPAGDPLSLEMLRIFQTDMYSRLGQNGVH